MNIDSSLFTDAMKYNRISLSGDKIKIHNYDGEGMGVMTVHTTKVKLDDADFVLNEKDYRFISKLGEIDLKVDDKYVLIKCKGSKFKFARLLEAPQFEVDNNDMKELDIPYEVLQKASVFTGNISTQPQYSGVNILNDVVMSSNHVSVFRKKYKNETGIEINIPGSAVKFIDEHPKIKFKTNGKFFLSMAPGRIFYTTLIQNKLTDKELNLNTLYSFEIKKDSVLDAIKMMGEYSEYLKFNIKNDKLNLICTTNEQEFEMNLDYQTFTGTAEEMMYSIKNLIMIIKSVEMSVVTINITDKALRIFDESKEIEYLLPRCVY